MSAALFVIAAATDWFDGHLARRWNVTTKLGSFLDTTADKLLVSGVLIALLGEGRVVALDRRDHRRPRARPDGAARPDRVGGRGDGALDARQAQDQRPVPRHHARHPAARRSDRRALHRRVGDARGRGDHRVVGGRLPGPGDPAADRRKRNDRLRHRRQRPGRRRARQTAGDARRRRGRARPLGRRRGQARGGRRAHRPRRRARRGGDDRGDARQRSALPRRRDQHVLPHRSRGAVPRQRPRRRDRRARRGGRRACAGSCSRRRPPRSARKSGTVGTEASPHRGSYMSVYERSKHEGEVAAFAAAKNAGIELVAVLPSSVQGPGPRRRHRARS